jgi:hypothetical protein
MAYGGLAEADLLTRPENAAFLHDGIEDPEQIQVQRIEGASHVETVPDAVAGWRRPRRSTGTVIRKSAISEPKCLISTFIARLRSVQAYLD